MEIKEITVSKKSDDTLITHIFQDEEGIKQITSDGYVVEIKLKDPQNCEWAGASSVGIHRIKGNLDTRYNKVELLSEHNRSRLFIDGTEIKGVTRLDIHRDANGCKTEISIDFECDLNTVQLKKDRVIVNECDYEELQKLATPLQVPFGDD